MFDILSDDPKIFEWLRAGEELGLDISSLFVGSHLFEQVCAYEDKKEKDLKPYGYRGFTFYPSYLGVYETLKGIDPALAIEFLETLIGYGVKDELPPDIKPLIKALMLGPMRSIDKAWENYLSNSAKSKKKR